MNMSSEPELGMALVKVKIEPSSDNEDNLELDDHCESAISASTDHSGESGDAESKNSTSEEEADLADNDEHVSTALELSTETIIDMARSAGVEVDEEIAEELKSASMNKLRYLTMLAIQFSQHENSSTIRVTDFEKAEETSKIPRNTRNVRPYSKKPEVPIDLLDTLRDERIHTVIIQKPNPILRVHFPNFVDLAPQEVDSTEESNAANGNDAIQFDVDSRQLYLTDEEIDCLKYDSDEEYEDPCIEAEDLFIDSGTNNMEFVDDFTSESEITIPTVDNNSMYFTDGDANEDDIQIDDGDPAVASPEMYWKEEKVENIEDSSPMSCDSPQNSPVLENENFDCVSNDEEDRDETLTNSSSLSDEESDAIISEEETEEALSVKDSKIFDDFHGIKVIEKIELDSSDIEIEMEGAEEEIEIDNSLDAFPQPKMYYESNKNEITEDETRNFETIDNHKLQISDNQSDISENETEVDIESSNSESDYEGEYQNFTDKVYENYQEEIVYESANEEMADEYIDETTQCVFDNPKEEVIYTHLDDFHTEEKSDEYDVYENFEEELVYDGIESVNEDNDEEEVLENPEEEVVLTDDDDVDIDEDLNQTQDLSPDSCGIAMMDEIKQDPSLNGWDVISVNPTEDFVSKRNGDLKSTEAIGQDESTIYDDPTEEFVCVKYSPTLPDSMNKDDEEHNVVDYVDANVQFVEDENTESLSFESDEYEYCDTEVEAYNENMNDVGNLDEKSYSHLDKDADLIKDSVVSNDFELDDDDTQIIDLSDSEVEIELNSTDGELDDLGSTDKQNVKNLRSAVLPEGKLFDSAERTSSFDLVGIRETEDITEEQTSGDDSDWETSDAESDWETSDGESDWETFDEECGAEKYDQEIDQAENSDSEIEVENSDQEIELEKSDDEIESKHSDQEFELISDQEIEFETSDQEFELENSDFEIDGENSDKEFEFRKSDEKIELENSDSFGLRHLNKDLEVECCTQEIELESSDRQEINLDNLYHEIEVKQSRADVEFENLDDNVQHTDREISNYDHRINFNDVDEVIESEDSDVSISEDSDDIIISEDSDNAINSDDLDEGINSDNSDGIINSNDSDEADNAQDSNELMNAENSDNLIISADSDNVEEVIESEDYNQVIESEDYDQVIESEDYDQVIESEDYDQVIQSEDYDQVTQSEDYGKVIKSEDYDTIIESEDYDQVIESEDHDQVVEPEGHDQVIESEDYDEVVESEDYDEVIESEDYDEVIESEDYGEVIESEDYDEVIESEDYDEEINSVDSDESIDLDESNTELYLQDSDTIIDLDNFDPRDYMDTDSDSLENEEIESENVFLEFEGRNDPELEEQPYSEEIECQNIYEQGELEYSNPGVDYCVKEADAENSHASNIHSYEQSELSNPNEIICDMESSTEGAELQKSIDASNIEYSNQGVEIEYSNEEMQLESFEYSNNEVEYEDPTQQTELEVPDENYANDDVDSSPSDEEILLLPNILLYDYPYNEPPAPTEPAPSSETVRSYVHNMQLFPGEDDECELKLEREKNDSLSDSSEENCLELSPEIKEQTESEESSSSESFDDVCNSNYKKQISFESIKLELENVEACIKCLNEDPGIKMNPLETKGTAEKVEEVKAKEDKSKCTDLEKKPSASDIVNIEDRCERKYNYVIEFNSINPDSNCENDEIIEAQNFSMVLNESKGKVRVEIKNADDYDASKFEYPNLLMVSEKYDGTEVSEFITKKGGEENHDLAEAIDMSIDKVESANDIIDNSVDEVENANNIDKSIDEVGSANNTNKSLDEVESANNADKSIDEVENANNIENSTNSMDKVESTMDIDKPMNEVENSNGNDKTSEENKVEEATLDTLSQQSEETAVDYELPANLQMTFDNSESAFNPSSPSDIVTNENDGETENSYEDQCNPSVSDDEDQEDTVDRDVAMALKHIPDEHRDDCEMGLVHAISDYVEDSSEESDVEGVMNTHIENNAVFLALQRYPILPVEWRDYMKMFIHNFYRNGDTLENDADTDEFSIILKDLRTHGAFPVLDIICDLFLDFLLRNRNRLEHGKPLTETAKNSLSLITAVLNAILECRLHCSNLHLKMICSVLIGLLTLPVECKSQQPLIQAFVKATVKYGDMLTWTKAYITETLSHYRDVPLINISENSKSLIGAAVGLLNGLKTIHAQIVQDLSIHEELLLILEKYDKIYSESSTDKCLFSENDSYIEQQLFEFFRSSIVNLNIKQSECNPYCKLREIVQETYGERVFTHTKIQEKSSKIDSRINLKNKKGFRGSFKVRVKSDKSPHTEVNLPNLKFEKECSYPLNCIL